MKDYFDLIWDENKPYFLLDYDKSLNKAIDINSLVSRVNSGKLDLLIEFEDNESHHPSVLKLYHRQDQPRVTISQIKQAFEDLKSLWNTQSLMYDYEKDPYLKIYGQLRISKTKVYNLGLTTVIDKSGKAVSPITLNKAMGASSQTDFLSIQTTSVDNDTFNFNKFLENRNPC